MPIQKLGPDETAITCGSGDVCVSLSKGDDQAFPTAVLFHPVSQPRPVGSHDTEHEGALALETRLPRVHLAFTSRRSLEVVIEQLRAVLDGWPAEPATEDDE